MNIIIPVSDNKVAKDTIAKGFHNSEFACIYNNIDKTYEWVETKQLSSIEGNLSIDLKRKGIYTVISSHMQLMSLGLFTESGIKVYKAKGSSVVENIKLFNENNLELFTAQAALGGMNCCSSCSSCSSSCK
jgi:predicted Fe-Mo cluster-binding NifX family protein